MREGLTTVVVALCSPGGGPRLRRRLGSGLLAAHARDLTKAKPLHAHAQPFRLEAVLLGVNGALGRSCAPRSGRLGLSGRGGDRGLFLLSRVVPESLDAFLLLLGALLGLLKVDRAALLDAEFATAGGRAGRGARGAAESAWSTGRGRGRRGLGGGSEGRGADRAGLRGDGRGRGRGDGGSGGDRG